MDWPQFIIEELIQFQSVTCRTKVKYTTLEVFRWVEMTQRFVRSTPYWLNNPVEKSWFRIGKITPIRGYRRELDDILAGIV